MPEFAAAVGHPHALSPLLSVVVAPNPSPMTHTGTNTYLLGAAELAVIDPGPDDPAHLAALTRAIAGRKVSHILLTHSHLDHSPLARPLANQTGAPVLAFGHAHAGRSPVMRALAKKGLTGGGEGIDHAFTPDITLKDGARVTGKGWALTALHTPGHIGNHMCFQWQDAVFTGDHVMGWASSLVSPPDGDLTDFMRSCDRLAGLQARIYYPGHGAPVDDPAARLDWLLRHRKGRENQIIAHLADRAHDVGSLTRHIYTETPPKLLAAAARNVFAHLIDLHQRGHISAAPALRLDATFSLHRPKVPGEKQ
ncbi:MBL fold metallo-hydrolase [Yoonia sp.]|uniref:MBL fold metallo-hydrolase n=1 Tax=Yoonia sp. TaxID=2212373 RepID=UPI003F6C12BF